MKANSDKCHHKRLQSQIEDFEIKSSKKEKLSISLKSTPSFYFKTHIC